MLQQVWTNLVQNSIQAIADRPGTIWVSSDIEGNYLKMTIEDNGPGIPQDMAQRIFEPFVTTKASGTGLGLSVAETFVTVHGGTLTLAGPRHGTGACFVVALPIAHEDAV